MARKCSHRGNKGHNARTCTNPGSLAGGVGLKLFGAQFLIASPPMKKSFTMDCLSAPYLASSSSSPSSSSNHLVSIDETPEKVCNGYLSEDLMGRALERKKGVPWTLEEHITFLAGLEKLGKGDWRGISRNFVITRTATQVASHAQKYFLRQNILNKRKRRSSLFDVVRNNGREAHMANAISRSGDTSSMHNSTSSQMEGTAEIDLNVPAGCLFPKDLTRGMNVIMTQSDSNDRPDLELKICS